MQPQQQADDPPARPDGERQLPLQRWLWGSYLRSALIPLLVIELSFIGTYWVSTMVSYRDNVQAVRQISSAYLRDVAQREALAMSKELDGISVQTGLFAEHALHALNGNYEPPAAEKARYGRIANGAFISLRDNGTTASYYSGAMPIGPEQIRKVWKLSALDPFMIDIKEHYRLVSSIYFNTFDSYNRIYPYFAVTEQYPARMDIPTYNFYYEADLKHNPQRKPVWTDAYVDPAGHGWMVSSIAPVWRGDKLEGVVGIDVTLETMIKRLNSLDLPWGSYAMLVDRQGGIIAMPPAGERDLGLQELTDHRYDKGIQSDTFKPDAFNLAKRQDTQSLARAIEAQSQGQVTLDLNGSRTASFATVEGPGWHLVIVAPTARIFAEAEQMRSRSQIIGGVMVGALLLFYAVFFVLLYRRALAMSQRVAEPVEQIASLVGRIGAGEYDQTYEGSRVKELDQLGRSLVDTGMRLGQAHRQILAQEQVVSAALEQQKRLNEEQTRFAQVTSHELRTPLAIIDSTAQIIDRKAATMTPEDIQNRATRLRKAVSRMSELLEKLINSAQGRQADSANEQSPQGMADLHDIVQQAAALSPEAGKAVLIEHESSGAPSAQVADREIVVRVLASVIENAARYGGGHAPIRITTEVESDHAVVTVIDSGPGIPEAERQRIGERFYRGETSFGTHGTGLGLHLARREIEGVGGSLELVSGSDGTRVRIRFPLAYNPLRD